MKTVNHVALLAATAAAVGIVLGMTFGVGQAWPHGWYTGTTDPVTGLGCCGGTDCAPIAAGDVAEVNGGFVYKPTGEFIPMSRVQQSRDWEFHRCVYQNDFTYKGQPLKKGSTRCFFSPPGSI